MAGRAVGEQSVPRPGPRHPWHTLDADEALALADSTGEGLKNKERRRRRAQSTARVVVAPVGFVRAAVDELANPLTPLLTLGAALSAAVGSTTDAALVSGVVAGNALGRARSNGCRPDGRCARSKRAAATRTCADRGRLSGELAADSLVVGDCGRVRRRRHGVAPTAVSSRRSRSRLTNPLSRASPSLSRSRWTATPGAPVAERASMLYDGSAIRGRSRGRARRRGRARYRGRSQRRGRCCPAAVRCRTTSCRAHPSDRAGDPRRCGMRLIRTGLTEGEVRPRITELIGALFQAVPSGVGAKGFVRLTEESFRHVMVQGAGWCVAQGYGWPEDLERMEGQRMPAGRRSRPTSARAPSRAASSSSARSARATTTSRSRSCAEGGIHDPGAARALGVERARPGLRHAPLRLARVRSPDRHRLPPPLRPGHAALRDQGQRPRARLRAVSLPRGAGVFRRP